MEGLGPGRRRTRRDASDGRVRCHFQCFPPPFNILSGFAIAEIDPLVSAIGVKLYTMHWPMIERAYVERLVELAGGDPDLYLQFVRTLLGTDSGDDETFLNVSYPRPSEPHPASDAIIENKIQAVATEITHSRMWGITHAYGPVADVASRFCAVHRASGGYVHINRYGYLSEAKIAAIEGLMQNA